MGITAQLLRAAGALAMIAATSAACGMDISVGGDDCGDMPAVDGCQLCNGVSPALMCVDGEWACPSRDNCSDSIDPDQGDCIDACGNWSSPVNGVCLPEPGCEELPPDDRARAQWSASVGSDGYERGNDIAIDAAGNVLIVGSFVGALQFDGGEMLSNGGYDIAIMKFAPSGALLWAVQRGGVGDDVANGIGVDASGRVVVRQHHAGGTSPSGHQRGWGTYGGRRVLRRLAYGGWSTALLANLRDRRLQLPRWRGF